MVTPEASAPAAKSAGLQQLGPRHTGSKPIRIYGANGEPFTTAQVAAEPKLRKTGCNR